MHETAETMLALTALLKRSAETAGPAIAKNFVGGGWSMDAEQFVEFWGEQRMATVSTVSATGEVHAVPLDARLVDGKFYIPTFPDAQRLKDHRANPRCGLTSWDGPYRAVIVYGNAREVETNPAGRTVETAGEQGYGAGEMVTIEVTPTRVYAIRPPAGHHAASTDGA